MTESAVNFVTVPEKISAAGAAFVAFGAVAAGASGSWERSVTGRKTLIPISPAQQYVKTRFTIFRIVETRALEGRLRLNRLHQFGLCHRPSRYPLLPQAGRTA